MDSASGDPVTEEASVLWDLPAKHTRAKMLRTCVHVYSMQKREKDRQKTSDLEGIMYQGQQPRQ